MVLTAQAKHSHACSTQESMVISHYISYSLCQY